MPTNQNQPTGETLRTILDNANSELANAEVAHEETERTRTAAQVKHRKAFYRSGIVVYDVQGLQVAIVPPETVLDDYNVTPTNPNNLSRETLAKQLVTLSEYMEKVASVYSSMAIIAATAERQNTETLVAEEPAEEPANEERNIS